MATPTADKLLEELRVYLPTESGANMYWEYDSGRIAALADRCARAEARLALLVEAARAAKEQTGDVATGALAHLYRVLREIKEERDA